MDVDAECSASSTNADVLKNPTTSIPPKKERKAGCNRCEVAECPNTSKTPGIRMFIFPDKTDTDHRKKWTHLCRRAHWKPGVSSRLCSAHFTPSDYRGKNLSRLRKDSVPSVFECLPNRVRPAHTKPRKLARTKDVQSQPVDLMSVLSHSQEDLVATSRNLIQIEAEKKVLADKLIIFNRILLSMKLLSESACLERANVEILRLQNELQAKAGLDRTRLNEISDLQKQVNELQKTVVSARSDAEALRKDVVDVKIKTAEAAAQHQTTVETLEANAHKQEFRVDKFKENDTAIQRLTGLPTYKHLELLFYEYFDGKNPDFLERFQLWAKGDSFPDRRRKRGRPMALSYFNQCFLALFKLRTGLTEDILSAIFCVSQTMVSQYYNCWVKIMHDRFQMMFCKWPDCKTPVKIPSHIFRQFPNLTCIVDCFEIRIQKPKNPDTQRRCYSNYKKTTTVKVFVAIDPTGHICYVSHIYQGTISDVEIVKRTKFLDTLKKGSVVLAHRGFQLKKLAATKGVIWIVPPSTDGNRGMTYAELELTYKTAKVRIHVERAIGRIKRWKELDGPLEISTLEKKDKEIQIVRHWCKFLPDLISDESEVSLTADIGFNDNVCEEFSVREIMESEVNE